MLSQLLSLVFVVAICLMSASPTKADTITISFGFGVLPQFDKIYVIPSGQHVVSIHAFGSYSAHYDDSPSGPPHIGSLSVEGIGLFQTPPLSFHGLEITSGTFEVTVFNPVGFDDGIASFSLSNWNFLGYSGAGLLIINTQEPLTAVPEPSTLILSSIGSVLYLFLRQRLKR